MAQSEYNYDLKQRDSMLDKQFDTATFLENLGKILKGFVYDPKSRQYISVQNEGYLNAVGARQVLNEIEGRIQNVNASANLRRQEIADLRQDVWFVLSKKLFVNNVEFGLKKENFHAVLKLVDNNLLAFFSRTEEGGFFNKLSNFFNRKEHVTQSMVIPEEPSKRRFST